MIEDKQKVRIVAIIDYLAENIPNYDGEIPQDLFFTAWYLITGTSFQNMEKTLTSLRIFGVVRLEGKVYSVRQKEYEFYKKGLMNTELIALEEKKARLETFKTRLFPGAGSGKK